MRFVLLLAAAAMIGCDETGPRPANEPPPVSLEALKATAAACPHCAVEELEGRQIVARGVLLNVTPDGSFYTIADASIDGHELGVFPKGVETGHCVVAVVGKCDVEGELRVSDMGHAWLTDAVISDAETAAE